MGVTKIVTPILSGVLRLKLAPELSRDATRRLKWFDYYNSHGGNARLTCRYYGISPQTFYRWRRRYDPSQLETLESRSHRPRHLRQPTASPELNGYVEPAHRTHTEEFYEVTQSSFELAELRDELMRWEEIYRTIRLHPGLDYLTPLEFIKRWQEKLRKEVRCH